MAGGAGAITAAGVVQADAVVQGYVEDRLLFAVIFVGKLVVFELDKLDRKSTRLNSSHV